ncbi:hypothetical protein BCT30_23710 [Enterovibrio norvegicus]|uniref:DUF4123 domain-containing protein n=1 Tax=Enterovibrio norvegicus TaxID=188144 RepID=UPI000368DB53|nr:DUF4123 domain-containing protein [Enterovibrio norvegicus]MCC4799777.1 DUF4123 domain-containing protein [Enterovibrio norvegicus]OEE43487.1 hypothetical protein A1OS_10735 [Enterovibrio norvegicus]PMI25931.1 hypothetical protein BCU47_23555 [Enterovibrio norvegicus]PMI36889.1 hypothetical protein BCU46_12530 [Enterovibrio norvegicus]PMN44633.1 hypothetical protein BCT30_23710 [Enterovibrio norvegicus]
MNSKPSFDNELDYWLIIDALRLPDEMQEIYTQWSGIETEPLFLESDFDYLLQQSPIIFKFNNKHEYLNDWVSQPILHSSSMLIGKNTSTPNSELLAHLRKLLRVSIDGRIAFLRYYTSAFWIEFNGELSELDRETLIAPATSVYWMQLPDKQPKNTRIIQAAQSRHEEPYYALGSAIFSKWV